MSCAGNSPAESPPHLAYTAGLRFVSPRCQSTTRSYCLLRVLPEARQWSALEGMQPSEKEVAQKERKGMGMGMVISWRRSRALELGQSEGKLGSNNREKRELRHGEGEVDETLGRKCCFPR